MKNKDFYDLENLSFKITGHNEYEKLKVLNKNELVYESAGCFLKGRDRELLLLDFLKTWLNSEHEILDKKEKEYLSAVIKPFRNKVSYIKKCEVHNQEYLTIRTGYSKVFSDGADLPNFEKNTMYRGMEPERGYTLEELGL